MLRAMSAALVAMAVVIGGSDGAGATRAGTSDTHHLGSTTVDPKTGVATWSATVECTPGDDVEIDITITQRGEVSFTELFSECPASGLIQGAVAMRIEEGSAALKPGPAVIDISRTDYVALNDFSPVVSSTGGDIRVRSGST